MIAVLYGHDDQVIAELQLPHRIPEINVPRMRTWYASTFDRDAPIEPLALDVDVYVPDERESTLLQLAHQNPDIIVYRRKTDS
jgi:hypothetical protein